jgi:hypothetical protein
VTVEEYRDIVFVDQTDVPYVNLKNLEGYLAAMREFCYKEEGTPLTHEHAIPRNKDLKSVWTGSEKMCVAIQRDRVLVCRPYSHYIKFGGPPKPRPPQPLSANGKPLGRKRTRGDVLERPGSFCSRHYGDFLEEAAGRAREVNGWSDKKRVRIYQDNEKLHWAPDSLEKAKRSKIVFFGDPDGTNKSKRPSTESPDCNCIENLFSQAKTWMVDQERKKCSESQEEANRRFEKFCFLKSTGPRVLDLVDSMPERMRDVISANGGPTRW